MITAFVFTVVGPLVGLSVIIFYLAINDYSGEIRAGFSRSFILTGFLVAYLFGGPMACVAGLVFTWIDRHVSANVPRLIIAAIVGSCTPLSFFIPTVYSGELFIRAEVRQSATMFVITGAAAAVVCAMITRRWRWRAL
ncbi:MAG: hypothetical protein SH859_09825 [Hyphomicrobium aestuarii]|nr:hypothetical protein [Hyphomicrobium aestuarii]